MSRRTVLIFLCLVLLAFAVLLLLFQLGYRPFHELFPSANGKEDTLVPQEGSPGDAAGATRLLLGRYDLTAVEAAGLSLSGETLSAIRRLGIPLELEIINDQTAALRIFDQSWSMTCDMGQLSFTFGDEAVPFSLQDGTLMLWDGEVRLVFEKAE